MSELATLQHWMQAAILEGAPGDARAQVRESNRLSAQARIGIYAASYRLRLIECLRAEYPLLVALAGPTAFELFARGYVEANPSRSYTLYAYGAGFADWLDTARPAGPATAAEAIPAALARIERAQAEVALARGTEETAAPETGHFLDTLLGLDTADYRLPDSVRLLALPFDFAPTLAAAAAGEPPALPHPVPSLLAVARSHWRVACHPLEPLQFDWLSTLAEPRRTDPRLAAWLPLALSRGIVVRA